MLKIDIAIIYMGIFPPTKGYSGGDRRVHAIAQGLQLNGAETTLIAPKYHNSDNKNQYLLPFAVKYLGQLRSNTILNRISFWKESYKFIKQQKANATIFYGPVLDSIILMILLRKTGIKVALELCDRISTAHTGLYGLWWRLSESWVPRFSQLNIVISKYLHDFVYDKKPLTPIITIPVLADPEQFTINKECRAKFLNDRNLPEDHTYLLYMGYMNTLEGVDTLLEAMNILQKTKVTLLMAGKLDAADPSLVNVECIIKNNSLDYKVKTLGFLSTKQVIEVLNAADIVMLPQRNTEFNKAGLPTKVAEYAAMSKAIIGGPIGDIPVYFKHGHNMFWVENTNAQNLVSAIETLVADAPLRNSIGKNARQTALDFFTPVQCGKKIIEALNNI
jgi:glycosyltransferase involved in cell wall biosynthesis